jgi:hypothetical protein
VCISINLKMWVEEFNFNVTFADRIRRIYPGRPYLLINFFQLNCCCHLLLHVNGIAEKHTRTAGMRHFSCRIQPTCLIRRYFGCSGHVHQDAPP